MEIANFQFPTMQEAVEALLADVTNFINSTGIEYLVVGGWSAYLRNRSAYSHPGTRDIDILFSDGGIENNLEEVIRGLLKQGYQVSAKHDFQLLRSINVSGHDLVFNVDLLHPSESVHNPEMMVDHFDLGIKDNELAEGKAVRSIVLPSSALLFYEGFSETYELQTRNLQGENVTLSFPLLGHAGLVLSKCESVKVVKRPRDAFDIFLAVESDTGNQIPALLKRYAHIGGVAKLLQSLRDFVSDVHYLDSKDIKQFDANVYRYVNGSFHDAALPSEKVLNMLAQISSI
jgi:hypothetical protein